MWLKLGPSVAVRTIFSPSSSSNKHSARPARNQPAASELCNASAHATNRGLKHQQTYDGATQATCALKLNMATTSNMFLYSLTIQPPTSVTQAILGQFSGTKEQQIIAASGSRLNLLRPDPAQGKVITLLSHEVFGIIRAISAFRLAGSNKGKLLLCSRPPLSLFIVCGLLVIQSRPARSSIGCQHDRLVSVFVWKALLLWQNTS